MKFERCSVEFNSGIRIPVWEEYSQFIFFKRFNWCKFHFWHFEIEYDRQCGEVDFAVVLLGFGIGLQIPIQTIKSREFLGELESTMGKIKSWKTCWIPKNICEFIGSVDTKTEIKSKRPKQFKNWEKVYIQMED